MNGMWSWKDWEFASEHTKDINPNVQTTTLIPLECPLCKSKLWDISCNPKSISGIRRVICMVCGNFDSYRKIGL